MKHVLIFTALCVYVAAGCTTEKTDKSDSGEIDEWQKNSSQDQSKEDSKRSSRRTVEGYYPTSQLGYYPTNRYIGYSGGSYGYPASGYSTSVATSSGYPQTLNYDQGYSTPHSGYRRMYGNSFFYPYSPECPSYCYSFPSQSNLRSLGFSFGFGLGDSVSVSASVDGRRSLNRRNKYYNSLLWH